MGSGASRRAFGSGSVAECLGPPRFGSGRRNGGYPSAGRSPIEEKEDYRSAALNKEKLVAEFTAQKKAGMFVTMTLAEARKSYGKDLFVAALAMLEQGEDSFRIGHDGTHDVLVNPRLKVGDQLTSPLGPDLEAVVAHEADLGSMLCLIFDVSMAHRRLSVVEEDWEFQACKPDKGKDELWLNTVGTFGIRSIARWWACAGATLIRILCYLRIDSLRWSLLFADDAFWLVRCRDPVAAFLSAVIAFLALGVPLKWDKFSSGYEAQWTGLWGITSGSDSVSRKAGRYG